VRESAALEVGDDLFDDGVVEVGGLGVEHPESRVGEHGVMAVVGEQLCLTGVVGVESADPAHDQPGADLLGPGPGGKRGKPDLGNLGVGYQPLLGLVQTALG